MKDYLLTLITLITFVMGIVAVVAILDTSKRVGVQQSKESFR